MAQAKNVWAYEFWTFWKDKKLSGLEQTEFEIIHVFGIYFKGYFCYKMITSQNGSSEAQVQVGPTPFKKIVLFASLEALWK